MWGKFERDPLLRDLEQNPINLYFQMWADIWNRLRSGLFLIEWVCRVTSALLFLTLMWPLQANQISIIIIINYDEHQWNIIMYRIPKRCLHKARKFNNYFANYSRGFQKPFRHSFYQNQLKHPQWQTRSCAWSGMISKTLYRPPLQSWEVTLTSLMSPWPVKVEVSKLTKLSFPLRAPSSSDF